VVEALLAKGADVQAKDNVNIARASLSITATYTCNTYAHVCVCLSFCVPRVPRVPRCTQPNINEEILNRGLSAIANTRLGQSGSGPQRDTVHNKSLQRVKGGWWEADEKREAGAGPEGGTRRVLVQAGWRGPGGWWREALTGIFSPAPQDGWTPLHRASQGGHLEVVGALLARGADVQAKKNVSIAHTPAPSVCRAHSRACNMRMAAFRGRP
jgi:hypothetical protein